MFRSRYFYTYFSISFVATQAMWWLWWLFRDRLPSMVPFNYLRPWGLDQLVAVSDLWHLPLYSSIALIGVLLLAWWLWRLDKFYSQLVLSSLMFLNLIALFSLLRVIILFG